MRQFAAALPVLLFLLAIPAIADTPPSSIALEALSRLKGMDLDANPSLKNAVLKVLESTRGTPDFVKIVQDFHLTGQNPGLLDVALKHPAGEPGVDAMRLILASGDNALLTGAIHSTNSADAAIEALGNTRDKAIVPLLQPLIADTHSSLSARRQAVRALSLVQEGAAALLQLAEKDELPQELKFTATTELNQVRWPELKASAARLLPLPRSRNTEPLPPLAELLKRKGDPVKGEEIFARQEVGCINCHRVGARGADVGPALTEIGDKMGKDALYESILDPSAGIEFGFEAWSVELKSGDEAYGIIVSETADEIVVKDTKAIPTHIKKSDIASRRQSKLSLMPTGLQQSMSTQELVDLVDYLSTLKKAAH